jgi:hypothetical protein
MLETNTVGGSHFSTGNYQKVGISMQLKESVKISM